MTCPCGSLLLSRADQTGRAYCDAYKGSKRMHGKPKQTVLDHSPAWVRRQARARRAIEDRRDVETLRRVA